MIEFEKSYESRNYKVSDNVRKGTGALGNQTNKLKTRKLEGQHKADPHAQIPMPRGYCCTGSHK